MTKSTIEPRFIAVEGAIGAGKTSLVNLFGELYGAQLILEDTESNPFISKFYEDIPIIICSEWGKDKLSFQFWASDVSVVKAGDHKDLKLTIKEVLAQHS